MTTFRIKKLQRSIKNPLLVRNPCDLFYLTGHYFSDGGFLFISKKHVVLFGGFLEKIAGIKTDFLRNIGTYLGQAKTLDLDDQINLHEFNFLKKQIPKVKLLTVSSPVQELRLIKEPDELVNMKRAYEITAKVFSEVKKVLRNSNSRGSTFRSSKKWTEQDLARFMRLKGLELGADDISFPVIVASGANAAVPHHVPSKKILKSGESIVLDFGFKVNGYCSDFTRTIFLKTVPKNLEKIYLTTEQAYNLGVKAAQAGARAKDVDKAARQSLAEQNLDKYFIHSLGHGTGLEVHEAPSLYPESKDILQNNMVFSIEPGVYLPGQGGVRIEDLVYLKNGKAVHFAKVSTKLEDVII
jgi:Xaa-Pro aminopeptidase